MGLFNVLGIYTIIPITIYLTISFFVLFAAGKAESKNLKAFGQAVAVLLWICALLIFIAGVWMMTTTSRPWDNCGKMCKKHMKHMKMMDGAKGGSCPMMPMMKK